MNFCLAVTLVRTFIISLFLLMSVVYCVPVWALTYPTNLNRIIIRQKVVRLISKKTFDAHTYPLFKEFQILKFDFVSNRRVFKAFQSLTYSTICFQRPIKFFHIINNYSPTSR